jgi:hypothetical protein
MDEKTRPTSFEITIVMLTSWQLLQKLTFLWKFEGGATVGQWFPAFFVERSAHTPETAGGLVTPNGNACRHRRKNSSSLRHYLVGGYWSPAVLHPEAG